MLQRGLKLHVSIRQPQIPLNKKLNRKLRCFIIRKIGPIPGPFNPPSNIRPRPTIIILPIKNSTIRLHTNVPFGPAQWAQKRPNLRFHNNSSRIILPWPPKVGRCIEILIISHNGRFLNDNAGVLVRVGFSLSRDGVELAFQRLSRLDRTVLEDHSGVAKDKINGSRNITVAVELTVGMSVESVLVAIEGASVEN